MEHLRENRNKLFLKPPNTLVEDYCIPPTLTCVRKTAGQLFSGHFHLMEPKMWGETILKTGEGWDFQSIRRIGTPYAGYSGDDEYKTHIRVETNACTPAPFRTNNPYVTEFPLTEAQSVIGSSSLPFGGSNAEIRVFSVQLYLCDSPSSSITAPIAGLGSKTCLFRQTVFPSESFLTGPKKQQKFIYNIWPAVSLIWFLYLHSSYRWTWNLLFLSSSTVRAQMCSVIFDLPSLQRFSFAQSGPSSLIVLHSFLSKCESSLPALTLWFRVWTFSRCLCSDPEQTGFFLGFKWSPMYAITHFLFHFL